MRDEPDRESTRARALAAFSIGDFDEALTNFSVLLRACPNDAGLLCNRSLTLLRLGRRLEAISDAEDAVAASASDDAQRVKALYRLASALHDERASDAPALQREVRAREVTSTALELAPANSNLLTLAASIDATLRKAPAAPAISASDAQPTIGGGSSSSAAPQSNVRVTVRRLPPPGTAAATAPLPPPMPRPSPPSAPCETPPIVVADSQWGALWHRVLRRLWPASAWRWLRSACAPCLLGVWPRLQHRWRKWLPAPVAEPAVPDAPAVCLEGLSALPSELLDEALTALPLLDLLRCKGVSRLWAAHARRLLQAGGPRLLAGTYVFSATWQEPHPAAMWPEEDMVAITATGTLSLSPYAEAHSEHTIDGWHGLGGGQCHLTESTPPVQLSAARTDCGAHWRERIPSARTVPPAAEDDRCLCLWWRYEPPSTVLARDPRRQRSELLYLSLSCEEARVSADEQSFALSGVWVGVPHVAPNTPQMALVVAETLRDRPEPFLGAAAGTVRVELRFLYEDEIGLS